MSTSSTPTIAEADRASGAARLTTPRPTLILGLALAITACGSAPDRGETADDSYSSISTEEGENPTTGTADEATTAKGTRERVEDAADRLTGAYLEGEWCALYGGQERSQYVFDGDGSYRAGPASFDYRLVSEGSIDRLLQDFEVVSVEPDRFVLNRRGVTRRNVFDRGRCP